MTGGLDIDAQDIRRVFPRHGHGASRVRDVRGDHQLAQAWPRPAKLTEAAVLVPIVDHRSVDPGRELTILLTRRTAHLAAHAGQISFPGGRMEPEDDGPEDCALRETEEEIGLPPARIDVLGRLDTYITRTAYRITPVVGILRPPFDLAPDANEVDEVFEVPLSFFLRPDMPEIHERELRGRHASYYVFPYGDYYIWGATAGMLRNFCEDLRAGC